MTEQTILIGLDGATFTILDEMVRKGVMPFLRGFISSGVRADLRSVIPALTPPAWTSMTTGRSPGQHGIFDFFCKDSGDSPYIRVATSRDVDAEPVWSIADRAGLRSTVLNFPLTFPPPPIRGFVVPGWMPWRQMRLGCHPADLFDRMKALPGVHVREMAMDMDVEAKAIEGCPETELEDWVELHTRREMHWFEVARHLMSEEPCELVAVLFDGMDKIQHACWPFIDPDRENPRLDGPAVRVREACLEYFRHMDRLLDQIAGLAQPGATIVIASDHGFGPQTGTFFVNAWLERRGDLAWADSAAPTASDPSSLGITQLARHVYLLDWTRTKAYVATPSSNGIHIVPFTGGGNGGSPRADYERFRTGLADALRAVVRPDTGEPILANVWRREEVFAGPYLDRAPDLTLELRDGGLVSILASDAAFKPRKEPSGTHRPDGVFLARGPGWLKGARHPRLSILDVAPVLLHGLGLPVPADMEGSFPAAALERGWLDRRPLRRAPARERRRDAAACDTASDEIFTKEDELKLMRHLRALGYIE